MSPEIRNTHEELNEISEEEFELYKCEIDDLDDLLDDLDLSKPQSYTPTIRDLERTSAVRHGYYAYGDVPCGSLPQSIRLGPQLLVRKHTACVPFNPKGLSEEPFLEFWLEPIGGVEPSPALQEIRKLLDENENNELPIPEDLLVLAKLENPDAPARCYAEWVPMKLTKNNEGLDTLRANLKLVSTLPEEIKRLTRVLASAVDLIENSYARMKPSISSSPHLGEPTLARSETVAADPTKLTGIASLSSKTTSAARPNPTAG